MSVNSKSNILTLFEKEKKEFDFLIEKLSEKSMETKIINNNQSIKEIIAHITYWDIQGTNWVRDIVNNRNPKMPWSESKSIEELRGVQAKLNKEMENTSKNKSLDDVIEDFNQKFTKLIKTVEKLTDEQFNKKFKFKWTEKIYSTQEIVYWRINHMKNHTKPIKDWLRENEPLA